MLKKIIGVLVAVGVSGGGCEKRWSEDRPLQQRSAEAGTEKAAQGRSEAGPTPTIGEKTAGMQKWAGYFNLYWDAKTGKLWLEIDKWGTEFLYQSGLPAGIGS